jgi:hypothetical protein
VAAIHKPPVVEASHLTRDSCKDMVTRTWSQDKPPLSSTRAPREVISVLKNGTG